MRYAELHCRTNFTFLEGASHADELVDRAVELNYAALAVTDVNTLAGVVRAHGRAKDVNLKLLIGAELTPVDAARLVVWATDRESYGRLCRLLTVGRRRAAKGACELTLADIAEYHEGLLAAVIPDPHDPLVELNDLDAYREIFGDRCYLLAELHYGAADHRRCEELQRLSALSRLPLVAAGDVHYHTPDRMPLQHVLTAIRHTTTVSQLGERCLPNAERHLRTLDELELIYAPLRGALSRTIEIANRCTFSLAELKYDYPVELAPPGETPMAYLRRLAWERGAERYPRGIPSKVRKMLKHELDLIERLGYEAFFLTVFDVVRYARSRGILCQGRGSAANSAVCFCLGVTAVDPCEHEMLFERFMSEERREAPDIDVDFEHERREEVLQYLYEKYGRERAGLAATVICYRNRSAVRDVGKALGLPLAVVDELAKNVDFRSEETLLDKRCAQSGVDPKSRLGRQLILLVNELIGFPRHLSQHVGGMVIMQRPLCELAPIENAAMQNRTVIQWDKDDLDELGILKVDCLALGMLTAIRRCFDLVKATTGRELTIASIPSDDEPTYDMICKADTVGVFQIESRAQMSMLPRLKPRKFYDLVIEVAIVRPGPIQGNMVHPYLRRRDQDEAEEYPSDEVRKVLKRTLGVPLFQEQAMQLAIVAAGFSPGEADELRRAMAAWRRPGLIDEYRHRLISGMLQKGYSQEFADRLFEQIRGFGEYGFPESHAASFAKLVYVSAYLKNHYPAEFAAALINSQPMGFYAPAQLVSDAQAHGVKVLPVDVNFSDWDCTLEQSYGADLHPAVRLGLRMVRGLSSADADVIVTARDKPFMSMTDLTSRTKVGRGTVKRLAEVDAFGSLELNRRAALWQALDQTPRVEMLPLFADLDPNDVIPPKLKPLTPQQDVNADYRTAGLSLRNHPIEFFRERLDQLAVSKAGDLVSLPHGQTVKVAGLVLMRQRPATAKGITFVTLEDESGSANLIVHPRVWARYEQAARRASALIVGGRLERKDAVVHVIVTRVDDLATLVGAPVQGRSRDFR